MPYTDFTYGFGTDTKPTPNIQNQQIPTLNTLFPRSALPDFSAWEGAPNAAPVTTAQTTPTATQPEAPYQFGIGDYTKQDLDPGRYTILDKAGNNLGIGYKSLEDTLLDYTRAKNPIGDQRFHQETVENPDYNPDTMNPWEKYITKDAMDYNYGGNYYSDKAAAESARDSQAVPAAMKGNQLAMWERLGQYLNYGGLNEVNSPANTDAVASVQAPEGIFGPRTVFGNKIDDPITGLQTLYGSEPVFQNGKLVGYKQDLNYDPYDVKWDQKYSTKYNDFMTGGAAHSAWNSGKGGLSREYTDPNWYDTNAKKLAENSYLVSLENAAKNPGWRNKDYLQGVAGGINKDWSGAATPILSAIMGGMAGLSGLGGIFGTGMGFDSTILNKIAQSAITKAAGAALNEGH